ncbi:MAG: FlgD immunoglobulin-like domain containing protein [Candidatus Zixiibacteriota bacterium]
MKRALIVISLAGLLLTTLSEALRADACGGAYITGEWRGDYFGQVVAGGSDINGDGVPDILASAPYWGDGQTWRRWGKVYIYSGADYSLLHAIEDSIYGMRLGRALDTLGDLNGDGFGDFIVGARYWPDGAGGHHLGAAVVFSGADYTPIHTITGDSMSQSMGTVVACVGDITKDGVNDFIAGGKGGTNVVTYPSRINIYNGVTGEEIKSFTTGDFSLKMGWSVAGVGDLDGDTYPDLVIASPGWDDPTLPPSTWPHARGSVDAYSGKTFELLWSVKGDTASANLGWDVDGAGDVNGDGYMDVICGSLVGGGGGGTTFRGGYVLIVSGLDGSVIRKNRPVAGNARAFGTVVAGLGDIDKDGYAEYSAADETKSGFGGGNWIFSGKDGSEFMSVGYGKTHTASAGDVDGNGTLDIVLGTADDANVGLWGGSIKVIQFAYPDEVCRIGLDTDGDGWNDECDICPYDRDSQCDSTGNGVGDRCTRIETVDVGSNVGVSAYATITFENVTNGGTVLSERGNTAPSTTGLFVAIPQGAPIFYNIETTASYTGNIQLCFRYDEQGLTPEQEAGINLYHYTGSAWESTTTSLDTARNEVCGTTTSLSPFGIGFEDLQTDVGESDGSALPKTFEVSQNYPNPFNPTTVISYSLPVRANVTVAIFNSLGQQVMLIDEGAKPAGEHSVTWNATDQTGKPVASGVYLYRVTAGDEIRSKMMLLLK